MRKLLKIGLITAPLLAAVTTGVVLAQPTNHSASQITPPSHTASVSKTETTDEEPQPAASAPVTTALTSTPSPAITPTVSRADLNRAQLEIDTRAKANALFTAMSKNEDYRKDFVDTQWHCIDRTLQANSGYDVEYNELLNNSAYVVPQQTPNPDGTTRYRFFDGYGTCRTFVQDL